MNYGYKPTTHGRELLTACAATEKPLRLTRVAIGSGMVPEDVNLADVHELYQYVTEGAVGERRHENDRLYLTIQYSNSFQKELPTFGLSEFIVYAEHPETGEETDLLYATLGDYKQPVPAYNADIPASVFNFPLVLIVSDEIEVAIAAAPGIVTHDDLQRLLNEGVIGISRSEIIIPADGWTGNGDDEGDAEISGYPYHVDIPVTGAKNSMTPILTIYPEYLDSAKNICQTAQTLEGTLRVYAKSAPSAEIKASLALIGGSGYIATASSGGDIPVASHTTLGGVILGPDFDTDAEGKLTVNKETVMTSEDLVDEEEVKQDVVNILDGEDET